MSDDAVIGQLMAMNYVRSADEITKLIREEEANKRCHLTRDKTKLKVLGKTLAECEDLHRSGKERITLFTDDIRYFQV
jgi:hypothetical protein